MNRRIIITSAFIAPERITSHLRGEGILIYAGKNIERFHAFRKTFGQKINYSSPVYFREFTISNRNSFVQWSEQVHSQYGHDLTHWLSDTFSSNPYMSNIFFYCMNLSWLRLVLKEHPGKDVVFVAESHALLLTADAVASENGDSEIFKCGFSKEKMRFLYGVGRSIISGYVRLLFLYIRYIFAYAYRIRKNNRKLLKVSVIVDTYIFENSFDEKGKFINKYFAELHRFLRNTGIEVGIYPVLYKISLSRFKNIFKSVYQNNAKFILLEDFLKPIDYLDGLLCPLKRLKRFERVKDFQGISIQPLINEENWLKINSSDFILSMLIHKLPKRLCAKNVFPSVYINWSENQTIHRAIVSGFHKYLTKTHVIGGKPFFPPLNHLSIFNTNAERVFGYAPDRIVTCGEKLKNIFSIYDKDGDYYVGASFRYGYLRNIIDNNRVRPGDVAKHRVISVLLPYSISVSRHILFSSTKAIHNSLTNGWNIKIKTHPTLTIYDIDKLLKEYDMQHECVEVTHEDIESLLPKSSAVISSASSVAVEAICLGIPVISIVMPIGLDFNMLDYLPSLMWKLAFTEDDIDVGLNKWALRHPLSFEERVKLGRKVLMDFFEKNTNESMNVYVDLLKCI